MLVSAVQPHESALSIQISPPSWASIPSHPNLTLLVITEHWIELHVLYHSFPPAIDFTHGSVYMPVLLLLLSHFSRVRLSVRPHGWQPTRLPCPWDSPGKNTGVGYVSATLLLICSTLSFPSLCPWVCPLCLCLYSCSANRIISTVDFSRFHIYVFTYDTCFFLPDLLHSVWQTLGSSTSLPMTQFHPFLWLSNNIPRKRNAKKQNGCLRRPYK